MSSIIVYIRSMWALNLTKYKLLYCFRKSISIISKTRVVICMKKVCPVCHKVFETSGNYQLYCSVRCRKIHHKEVYYDRTRPIPQYVVGDKVLREFRCNKCHKLVLVTSEKDRRRKFCSPHCEKLYWKHPRKPKIEEKQEVV